MNNPLLEALFDPRDRPVDPIPFDRIDAAHVEPALTTLAAEATAAVDAIAADTTAPTYESTLGALERATLRLESAASIVEHLESAATSEALREAWGRAQPVVSTFWSKLPLHEGLYGRLVAFSETAEARALEGPRRRHLDKTLEEFRRHGAALGPAQKARLTEVDVELAKLTTKYQQNVLDATNAFELVVEDESRLAGLPAFARTAARKSAEDKGYAGFRFTLHAPSFIPAVTYIEDASIREQLYRAFNGRASSGPFDNRDNMREILRLRDERARLLGFADFVELTTSDRMAKTGARVRAFIDDLRDRTIEHFEREKKALADFTGTGAVAPGAVPPRTTETSAPEAHVPGAVPPRTTETSAPEAHVPGAVPPRTFNAWDIGFLAEKQRKALFDFDEEAVRPHFPLEHVLDQLFVIFQKLYGVRFEPVSIPVWDEAVRPFALVSEEGRRLATVYVDLFPRANKVQGAWMVPLRSSTPPHPHVAVVCANFTPPMGTTPSLLAHREVQTLFHEFGHLLHQCLSNVPVRRLAGTSVAWDFVELPSQLHENWVWERDTLLSLSKHWETGARMPEDLVDKLIRSRSYRAASAQMQQLGYADIDLRLHVEAPRIASDEGASTVERAKEILSTYVTAPIPEGYAMIASFVHLFGSPVGYAAGYYSYKWAEVLEADAFSRFAREGLLSRDVGRAFVDTVLSRGNSDEPEALFRDFLGRDPTVDALLLRQGLG